MGDDVRTAYRTCPLCEATCGLEITLRGDEVEGIRGDRDDVFSRGFLCPKATGLKALQEDPDRVRTPLIRRTDGTFEPATWDEAFAEIDRRLAPILERHGRDAAAIYLGNPVAHSLTALAHVRVLARSLGSRNVYSASTVDQMPKQVAAALMLGTGLSIPVPDVDRTDHLLILGANPLVSNGSLLTAPDMRGRLRAIRERGGKVVVVDPRRTRTAEAADEHHFIRPGTDALLLFALVHVLFAEGLARPGRLADLCSGIDEVEELARDFQPEAVAPPCGIAAEEIRRMARELAAAPSAAVYGRIGTCTQEFGTLASWLVDVLNVLTGNLDRPGGAMLTTPATGNSTTKGPPAQGRGARLGRWHSRVRGLPEAFGELPVACLAEEIDTPGEGQVRALVTVAGNPALSTPDGARLERGLEGLELLVSVDVYVNETTRHAHVILPAPAPLERSHYDVALYNFAARNVAHYSQPVLPRPEGMPEEWETLLRLAGVFAGQGPNADVAALDGMIAAEMVRREVADPASPVAGGDVEELLTALEPRRGPERLLDFALRTGPYGDGFGTRPDGLSLAALEATPHGVDLGPLEPRLPDALRTASGRIELAPDPLVADVPRLRAALEREGARASDGGLVLVGRRHLRSNNSWMHNLRPLVKGKPRCTLHVHPDDAARLGLADGGAARVTSRVGSVLTPVEVTDEVMPGVVSLPHGWGHDAEGAQLAVALEHAGVSSNVLTDGEAVDAVCGNAVLNGIPVTVEAAETRAAESAGPAVATGAGEAAARAAAAVAP